MSTKKLRNRSDRAARMRLEREREQAHRTRLITTAIVAAVVLLVVIAAVAIIPRLGDEGPAPSGLTADNGFRYTVTDADTPGEDPSSLEPVEVILYEDFQCPTCQAFESSAGGYLETQVGIGAVEIEYRPVAILDNASSTNYSTRSANAAACVHEDAGIAAYVRFHGTLYVNQPPEGGAGLTNDELTQIATQSGAGDGVGPCISNGTYDDWVAGATEESSKAGIVGTPTVLVDGEVVTGDEPGTSPAVQNVMAAISAARAG